MATRHIDTARFDAEVLQAEGTALVDFWAPWCAPCRAMEPALEKLSEEWSDRLTVYKVNVDEEGQIAQRFRIRSIPTLIAFRDGKEVARLVGARQLQQLKSALESVV